ncbi:hypothetical protein GPJ56_001285 [Histomonas meleagridis]|uniref:uncharacterized protein n=1 Tax=Histomonas meleagridis TaxID=135588 RepID=UPI00355A3A05|nr:hypothetical protein GPJ56_001285 [Histomonas meleagridis]KAH0805042.1 hypothetical protein GO595_001987 [Histomonas meleagridis]
MKAKGKRIILVTIFGSYQIGKSSTIKKLTGDCRIHTGDGNTEDTMGAYVYGPYLYNEIRQRFGIEEIEDDDTQIFFVDTEGCGGFQTGESNSEANTFLLSQLIAPYASLSSVVVSMSRCAATASEVSTMKKNS